MSKTVVSPDQISPQRSIVRSRFHRFAYEVLEIAIVISPQTRFLESSASTLRSDATTSTSNRCPTAFVEREDLRLRIYSILLRVRRTIRANLNGLAGIDRHPEIFHIDNCFVMMKAIEISNAVDHSSSLCAAQTIRVTRRRRTSRPDRLNHQINRPFDPVPILRPGSDQMYDLSLSNKIIIRPDWIRRAFQMRERDNS